MKPIYVAHEGSGTLFDLADTGYIFSQEDLEENPGMADDIENGDCEGGYEVTPGLAIMFYELAKSYWEFENKK